MKKINDATFYPVVAIVVVKREVIVMAVADMTSSQLRLVLYDGEDLLTGKPIYRSKNFNNVKPSVSAKQLFDVAVAFSELQERELYMIERRDNSEITRAE